ncbi:MAG: hypothetical protein M1820_005858 [Bogoriella megaspora]|nr:MAG: hypothetical protein M1820_005858 [Bogoriella megaspora]
MPESSYNLTTLEPAYNFTTPSLHDDIALDCRIYVPDARSIETDYSIRGAVLAHPYAPLGGCYNDPVLEIVTRELLKHGYFICTFNFRGAHGSSGRTSWTGKGETHDYVSVAGFFAHYLHLIQDAVPTGLVSPPTSPQLRPATAANPSGAQPSRHRPQIILGGYSYGSLIASRLPPLSIILANFVGVPDGTAAAEILCRARTISSWTNENLASVREQARARKSRQGGARKHSPSITMGGEETPMSERASRDVLGKRSIDLEGIRKSLEIPRRTKEKRSGGFSPGNSPALSQDKAQNGYDIPSLNVRYLLISPVFGVIGSSIFLFTSDVGPDSATFKATLGNEKSLLVYGDEDVFTNTKKTRQWTGKLSSVSSKFRAVEVSGAGHFWREPGAAEKLTTAIRTWAQERE